MTSMKAAGNAPQKALVPSYIEKDGLFKLDVDDSIWQDVGLDDETSEDTIPDWLGDDKTKNSIKAFLELQRCIKEEACLAAEHCGLQEWFLEEWNCLS